jgi:hypothetical protein
MLALTPVNTQWCLQSSMFMRVERAFAFCMPKVQDFPFHKCKGHHNPKELHMAKKSKTKTRTKPANQTKCLVLREAPQVTALAIQESNLPSELRGLAVIQSVSLTPTYLDSLSLNQEIELCKSGLRISHSLLCPLLIHLKARRHALKLRDWDAFCRTVLGYTSRHCDRLISQAKRDAKLMLTEEGRQQLETAKEEKRIQAEEKKSDRQAHKRVADAKAQQDAEELLRRRRNERALEAKPTPEMVAASTSTVLTPAVPISRQYESELKDSKQIHANEVKSLDDEITKLRKSLQTVTLANTTLRADIVRLATLAAKVESLKASTIVVDANTTIRNVRSLAQKLLTKYNASTNSDGDSL